jgi:hypothetical protein
MPIVKKLISLESGVARELEMVAKTLDLAQREVVERALDFYFDYTDAAVAQKLSQEIEQGTQQVHDADEVFEILGL